jgi:TATA-box binding protein (TBP) (component of TFIID and TFIIIB)
MSLDDAWMKFMIEGSDSVEIDEIVPKIIPECGPIVISTKTKILYFNISVDLNYIFWKLSMISYDYMGEGIIKKQMKFNFQDRESVQEFEDNIKDIKLPIDIKILNQFENPNGRIKFKDVRKVSIGLSKKDVINYKKKSKSAFYNCFVIIYRIMFKGKYKEIHLKLFNSGKIEIPGIQDDCILDIAVQKIIGLLQPFYNYIIHEDICKRQTILVNSNFNCNYYIHRENLFRILKKEYSIKCSFDSCSYPGIQCKYKLSNQQEISFMIFRTGSILIVGKCENEDLYKIYEYIKTILNNHFSEIYQQNTIAKVIKPKKKIFKTIYIA